MRPTVNFAFHAILAACLAALAASSAAAGGPAYIRLGDVQGETAGRNDGRVQQLEIHSWQWSGVSKVDSFTVKQGVKPSATGENVQGAQDIVITGSRIPQPNQAKGGGLDAGMKQLEAKDRMGNASSDPALETGTLRVKVKMPWLACEEGRTYPSLELSDGSERVALKDAVITSCGRLKYNNSPPSDAKVKVRGWDPEKKE